MNGPNQYVYCTSLSKSLSDAAVECGEIAAKHLLGAMEKARGCEPASAKVLVWQAKEELQTMTAYLTLLETSLGVYERRALIDDAMQSMQEVGR